MSALVLAIAAALAVAIPAAPTRWVEDHASLISPATRDALDARLEAYEHATGHQIVVWIDRTLDGAALDDWAVRTFAAWKVGRAGLDDGIAMFVFAADRKIDIEVGYGLEAQVPDAVAARIIREVMAPGLRAGDADAAIRGGVDALLTAIEGKPWPAAGAAPPSDDGLSTATWIIGGIAVLAMLILFVTHPHLFLLFLMFARVGGRGGGFGGGGGRSGGGGARGGW